MGRYMAIKYKVYALSDDGEVSEQLGCIYDTDIVFDEYWKMFLSHRILLIPEEE